MVNSGVGSTVVGDGNFDPEALCELVLIRSIRLQALLDILYCIFGRTSRKAYTQDQPNMYIVRFSVLLHEFEHTSH